MEATKEELKAVFKDLLSDNDFRREIRSEISPVGGLNPEAKSFKAEVKDELRKRYEQRFGKEAYGSYKLGGIILIFGTFHRCLTIRCHKHVNCSMNTHSYLI